MKVTYNWLKDFVDIQIAPDALANRLTMAGLEVTSLEPKEEDFILELEVTSNRPDCLSVAGIAREVAAITGKRLKAVKPFAYSGVRLNGYADLTISILDKKDCPFYTAKVIKAVKLGPAPGWIKKRLELIGCRSVNNIVDIANYVLFEQGEPLHAFDFDKLSARTIIVRRAKYGERITTIDGTEKTLSPEILVIADNLRPLAIAGIMGSQDTEVGPGTKNILLEAAVFNPLIIRRARQRLGLQSDSSYRFERGVDSQVVAPASSRAARLIEEVAGGECVFAKAAGLARPKKKHITLALTTVDKILGVRLPISKSKKILDSLGFKVGAAAKNSLIVRVPAHRADVNLEIDLIEEIARVFGYDNIPVSLPRVSPRLNTVKLSNRVALVKDILVGLGLNEVITYSLIARDTLSGFWQQKDSPEIEILNPLSKEQEILRPTILPGLLSCLAYNLHQKQGYVNIFEVAKAFLGPAVLPKEELVLGVALCGERSFLLEQGLIKDQAGFLHLKGISETIFKRLGIKDYHFTVSDAPGEIAVFLEQEKAGRMLRLARDILDKFNIKNKEVFMLEFSLDKIFSYAKLDKRFAPLAKYPGITRDISLIVKEDVPIRQIKDALVEKGAPLLSNVEIADYYKGKQIPAGYKGVTISCLYRSGERTLKEAEINPLHASICSILSERFRAQVR